MKKFLFTILFTGISILLNSQIDSSGIPSPDECFNTYMELKAKGKYAESDKWMNKFAELRPNDLRTIDYYLYQPELKNLLLDNGNYTIHPVKYIKRLKIRLQKNHTNLNNDRKFEEIRKRYAISHPFLTSNGKTLYFDSTMPGGFGQSDLYRIPKREDGSWGKPENLGDKVNTEGNECYPYYKEDGRILFFSSDGRYGLGGLDIFIYAIDYSGFGKAYNAGYPLNSRYDDFALSTDDSVKQGYFKSNRNEGKGKGDLYSVVFH